MSSINSRVPVSITSEGMETLPTPEAPSGGPVVGPEQAFDAVAFTDSTPYQLALLGDAKHLTVEVTVADGSYTAQLKLPADCAPGKTIDVFLKRLPGSSSAALDVMVGMGILSEVVGIPGAEPEGQRVWGRYYGDEDSAWREGSFQYVS